MTAGRSSSTEDQPDIMFCAAHPDVETGLTCGGCGTPICPRCMVQTPVGGRCRDCARMRRLPTFDVSTAQYGQAAAIAAGVALVLGVMWGFLPLRGFGSLIVAAGVGFIIGEAISRALGRKRSTGLKVIAGLGVVGATLSSPLTLLALALGVYLAMTRIAT